MVEGVDWQDVVDAVNMARNISNDKDESDFFAHRSGVIASFKLEQEVAAQVGDIFKEVVLDE